MSDAAETCRLCGQVRDPAHPGWHLMVKAVGKYGDEGMRCVVVEECSLRTEVREARAEVFAECAALARGATDYNWGFPDDLETRHEMCRWFAWLIEKHAAEPDTQTGVLVSIGRST